MPEPAFQCVGFTPRSVGLIVNCGNCKMWIKSKCQDRRLLDELYVESPKFNAYDHIMRDNKGVRIDAK
jgi:hypothetical protein